MSNNKNIYINSLEAADIFEHQNGRPLNNNFVGMIPFSQELIKLKELGVKTYITRTGKNRTNDIINLKFKKKVLSSDTFLDRNDIERHKEYLLSLGEKSNIIKTKSDQKKNDYAIAESYKKLKYMEKARDEEWSEIRVDDLREYLYTNGFTYNGVDYVVYKRTSAKSRTGQCQFIKKPIRDKAIRWARLGMNLEGFSLNDGVDFPSLLAYEGLVSSSIVDQIYIHPNNIFIIDDVISKFTTKASVVKNIDGTNNLMSEYKENHIMESDLFDGEGILDESYFPTGIGSMLLRQHMYKSCEFNGGLKQFLIDHCPEGIKFEDWILEDMFGNKYFAKDIHMVTTPNSFKSLKFYKRKKTKKLMYEHWRKKVIEDKCLFGICKYEKSSKRGFHEGEILNQVSYQIINSMPYTYDEIEKLSQFELGFINDIKNDIDKYCNFLQDRKTEMNSNEMLFDIYKANKDVSKTMLFKNKRKSDINGYVNKVKSGKVRLKGDYCTICQNPKELLYHTIGKLPVINGILDEVAWKPEMELIGNQCYTPLHEFGYEYSAFRNPQTAPSNVLILENVYREFIDKYMNPSNNIIYTNAIGFEINRILSGQDVDSDSLLLIKNKIMLSVAKKCFGHYSVCDNKVSAKKMDYSVSTKNMARIDSILSSSQGNIGEVVNLGQHCMSEYWDEIFNNGISDRSVQILKYVDICTILSEIAIDMAKKLYDVDFKSQVKSIKKELSSKEKPNFFRYISKNNKVKLKKYNTPMDYLGDVMSNVTRSEDIETIDFMKTMKNNDFKITKKNIKQSEKFDSIINEYIDDRRNIYKKYSTANMDKEEKMEKRYIELDESKRQCEIKMSKYKATKETMYHTIDRLICGDITTKEVMTFMNVLYKINKDVFLSLFNK